MEGIIAEYCWKSKIKNTDSSAKKKLKYKKTLKRQKAEKIKRQVKRFKNQKNRNRN